jgi:excisionase family DNA binding protein
MKAKFEQAQLPLAYRVRDFCKTVGVGKTKFYELLRAGKIKTITIGGRRLVPADEAQRIVQAPSARAR